MPIQSASNTAVVVVGGGCGLTSVLRALRGEDIRLTVIANMAYAEPHETEGGHRAADAAVEDLRTSLEALTGEEGPLLRVIRRPLAIEHLGRRPLGDLVIASTAAAFGDYGRASTWLGEQLGVDGAVLPATVEPVQVEIEGGDQAPRAGSRHAPARLRYLGQPPASPEAAVAAVEGAQWVLLAPGSLYRDVLSTAAVPDLVSALRNTPAEVLWIANLQSDSHESADMTAIDHLRALRLHDVRVDGVMHDPSAMLKFDPAELTRYQVESIPRVLCDDADPAVHDAERLRRALRGLVGSRPACGAGC